MSEMNEYLLNIYLTGEDFQDPSSLPSWFSLLLAEGYLKVLPTTNRVVLTEKGLLFVESLGIVPPEPIRVSDNKRFQALLKEARSLLITASPSYPYDVIRAEWMAELHAKLFDCQELARRLQ